MYVSSKSRGLSGAIEWARVIITCFVCNYTYKPTIGMYSRYDYLIPTNLVCILFGIAIPTSFFLFNCFYTLFYQCRCNYSSK